MKFRELHIAYDIGHVGIEQAEYLGDFKLRIVFDDKKTQTVDFKPFLLQSKHPSIKKYMDENLFKEFQIMNGNLNWGDYDLIFPLSELYNGKITY
ncbi:hypothetical protein GCM10028791_36710 [Echinicola sediminis]